MAVKRYDPEGYDGLSALMREAEYGEWVGGEDYDALLSLNAELLEAFETATKNVIAFVIELELGKPATSAQIEKTIQLAKPGTMVGDMVAAIAKARSQS